MIVTPNLSDIRQPHNESSTGLRVPFGFKDGKMYEPRQVPLGKACGCICPSCKSPLVAKHALKKLVTPHFSHLPGQNCLYGRESAIHFAAKQLIEEHHKLYIPDRTVKVYVVDEMGREHSPERTLVSAGLKDFSSVRLEQNISDFRPDLVATTINGNDLLVEIAVTHFVNDIKQKKIENHGTAAIEIDASEVPILNFDALAQLLFEPSSHAEWLFHPRDEPTKLALRERLTPVLEAAKIEAKIRTEQLHKDAEKRKRDEDIEKQRQAKIEEQNRRNIEEFKAMNVDQKLAFSLRCLDIDESMIPAFLDHKVRCEWSFKLPRRNWQLSIFGAFIQKHTRYKNATFRSDAVVEWVEQRFDINKNPEYPHSHKVAVWDFLINLSDFGILNSTGYRWFDVEQNDLKEIIARHHGIPYNIDQINLSNFHLEWVKDWPNRNQVELIAKRYMRKYGTFCNWDRLADLLSVAKEKAPQDIARYYSSGKDGAEDVILKFMVEARFVRLHKQY